MFNCEHMEQCHQFVVACNERHAWRLDTFTCEHYAKALEPLLDGLKTDLWETVVTNYHNDHITVAALRDNSHPDHNQTWARWSTQAFGVLRRTGLNWSHDRMIDTEDIAQIAQAELARALPGYRYRSRFSSWAYSVIWRCAQRQIRMGRAQCRSATIGSLDMLEEGAVAALSEAGHEQTTQAHLLAAQVAYILAMHPDRRLTTIFQLWAIEERTSAEIGAIVQLHESRVRALLKQARELLRADPSIQCWANKDG